LGSLERQRSIFAWKVAGLDENGLSATVGASELTLGKLLKHLAFVEDFKFGTMLRGRDLPQPWADVDWANDQSFPWRTDGESPESLYQLWHDAVGRARDAIAEAVAAGGMDVRIVYGYGDNPEDALSLRRLLVDMIEEYARHSGHADLLRESVDGVTGEDPPAAIYPYVLPASER
jgi:hypothetical protein